MSLTLQEIQDAFGLKLSGEFIETELKVVAAKREGRAVVFDDTQLNLICDAMIQRCAQIKTGARFKLPEGKPRKNKDAAAAPPPAANTPAAPPPPAAAPAAVASFDDMGF